MSARSKSCLVYVHGTNGSGKSTLARALVALAGGSVGEENHVACMNQKAFTTYTNEGALFLGRYGNACGGVDGFSPYAAIHTVLDHHFDMDDAPRVFGEGLITPGVETCQQMAARFDNHLFIALDVPVGTCITNVLRRRRKAGNDKLYDPANLYKKAHSVRSWADRLEKASLNVQRLGWRAAYLASANLLRLDNINHLL